ncbi:undecaprenyl-phosphate glucose phosphotransferase [Aurantimonas sp. Leaf443]|uniref:undecaprenyl-phosphate glucose phosphotransferase n=1 Tax=Aurantimonas sp. Leaf443 TaxID=1736378 RepID=UPI0006FDBD88|nr:undecaprenyl-phosphate glucose phosphotransferase [Aurantimonas sp. Leaf443]KQT86315.1 undecaprenyl-phosphate glucose phosphotransferase [Aurantimonas sp. Leaf443]
MKRFEEALPFTRSAIQAAKPEPSPQAPAQLNDFATRMALQYRNDFITPRMLTGTWRLAEFVLLAALGYGLFLGYVGDGGPLDASYLTIILLGSVLGVVALGLSDCYEMRLLRSRLPQLWRMAVAWAGALSMVSFVLFFLYNNSTYSRVWLGAWLLGGIALLALARLTLRSFIARWARNGVMERRAVIVGGGKAAESLIRNLEMQPGSDIRICGIFDDRDDRRSPPLVAGYPKLGTIRELVEFARLARIDMLIVTLPLSAETRVLALLKELWVLPLDIRMSALSASLRFRPRSYSFVGQVPMLDVFDRPLADWDGIAKRAFDLVVASAAIVVLSPILAAAAIAIKLDSRGPVFFRQKRHGFNNQIVDVYKFRSLYHEMCDPLARRLVTKNDSRVTRVGRFIRKTSIDELPQLINVVKGELSLVGPRPHAVHAVSSMNETFTEIVDGYFGRHKVKPGITGWAQINGWRGEIDQPEKLRQRCEHDLYYIENWSLLLDIYILAMTPISLLRTESAY